VTEVFSSRLQWRREIEEGETWIAGFVWNGLVLIQLFSVRSKMNDAGLISMESKSLLDFGLVRRFSNQ
jgi:hypothetical protein